MPNIPIGLMVRDPAVRRREEAVRRLLESGVLRTESLIEALLTVAPEPFLGEADATAMFSEKTPTPATEGEVPTYLPFTWMALALEALGPLTGDRVADTTARSGYVAALLATLVGQAGRVTAVSPVSLLGRLAFARRFSAWPQVEVVSGAPTTLPTGEVDAVYIGGALPKLPSAIRKNLADGGRVATFLGPRFRPQDLVCLVRRGDAIDERRLARGRAPVLAGPGGWLAA